MHKISAILTSSLLAFAGVVSFGSPASATDTVDLFLDSFAGTQSYSAPQSIHALGDKLVFLQQGSKLLSYDKVTQTTESLMPNGSVF